MEGPVGGVNSNLSADGSVSVPEFLGNSYSSARKPAGRLEPAYSGKLVRVDLANFSSSGVEVGNDGIKTVLPRGNFSSLIEISR